MKKRTSAACMGLALFLLLLGLAFWGFERVATDAEEYIRLEDRLDLYGEIGVSREEMVPALEALAAYIRGETKEYNRDVVMFGETRPLFNEREIRHMVDVAALFRLERRVKWACLLAAAALAEVGAALGKKRLSAALKRGALFCFLLILALATAFAVLYALIGFEGIFIGFHRLFFTNDLWLMYYDTDAMIRMFPQEFFELLAGRILRAMVLWAGCGVLVWTGAFFSARFKEKRRS